MAHPFLPLGGTGLVRLEGNAAFFPRGQPMEARPALPCSIWIDNIRRRACDLR